jgi:hypothetical protein
MKDTVIEKLGAYLVDYLNAKADGIKVVESIHFTNTYFNKLFGGFPLLVIWRSQRYYEKNYFSGSSITIHYLLASAADYQQVPGILNSVACWIYEAVGIYCNDCPLLDADPESFQANIKAIAYSGTKGTTELPLLEITFNVLDSHNP